MPGDSDATGAVAIQGLHIVMVNRTPGTHPGVIREAVQAVCRAAGGVYPFCRTARIVHNPLTIWATATLTEAVPVLCRNGLTVCAVPSELIGRKIYLTGTFDPHLLAVMTMLARTCKTIVDVGANIGFFSLAMASVAPTATVHAVEPQQRLAELIERSAGLSGISNIAVHKFALSTEFGDATMAINPDNFGNSSIQEGATGEFAIAIKVRAGDEFLDSLGVEEIDLIKVDVEGHELQVLSAIEPWLAARRIRTLIVETRGHGGDQEAAGVVLRHGYRLLGVDKGLTAPRICQCPVPHHAKHEDLIAIRSDDFAMVLDSLRQWLVSPN